MTGMDSKLCAGYRFRVAAGVLQRDRHIGIPVPDHSGHFDGANVKTPRPGEQPEVLSDSLAAAAECFHVAVTKDSRMPGCWRARISVSGSPAATRRRNSRGQRRASAARRPRDQPPNSGACRVSPKESRSAAAIPRVGQPGGPSGETSVRLRARLGIPAAHAAANGPPAEMPSSAAVSARSTSSTSTASSTQSARHLIRRRSVPPVPGRSGAITRSPSSRAACPNQSADSRESARPWQRRTGDASCSPTTSTAITLPSPRHSSITR